MRPLLVHEARRRLVYEAVLEVGRRMASRLERESFVVSLHCNAVATSDSNY